MWPKSLLMVSPDFFDVEYQINPHMVDADGNLHQVDQAQAMQQWVQYRAILENLGLSVETLAGEENLPDMVFCANQTFPFMKDNTRSVILSQMQSPLRQTEVDHFSVWAKSKNWKVYNLNTDCIFEGMGDCLWNYETGDIYGGYGFRTELQAYDEVAKIVGCDIKKLQLVNSRFYHLDTCLSILGANTAAYVPQAFSPEAQEIIKANFPKLIEIPLDEAMESFAGNCFSPNGKDVLIQQGARKTSHRLSELGFNVIPVETSEFIKAGGSVFCMKQMLF